MKATGEVMAIASSFEAALMKAIRSLEQNVHSLRMDKLADLYTEEIEEKLANVDDERIFVVAEALRRGFSPQKIHKITMIDIWFLDRMKNIVELENTLTRGCPARIFCAGQGDGFFRHLDRKTLRQRPQDHQGPAGVHGYPPLL
jgi:hypothetical protein